MPKNKSFSRISKKYYKTLNELKKYQNTIRENPYYAQLEQVWVNQYLQPIINMMGSSTTWKLFPEIIVNGLPDTPNTRITRSNKNKKFANNDGKHWTGQYKGELFNSFDIYQLQNTSQLCQTYTLMWLTDNLPNYDGNNDIDKYYYYTKMALNFIEKVVLPKYDPEHHRIDEYWICIKELQKHPAMCLNVVDLP